MKDIDNDSTVTRVGEMFGVPVYYDPLGDGEEFTLGYKAINGAEPGIVWLPYVRTSEAVEAPEGATEFEPSFILTKVSMERLSRSAKIVKMAILSKCPTWKVD